MTSALRDGEAGARWAGDTILALPFSSLGKTVGDNDTHRGKHKIYSTGIRLGHLHITLHCIRSAGRLWGRSPTFSAPDAA